MKRKKLTKGQKRKVIEVLNGLIYHGRHFSKFRDEVVIKKCYDRIKDIIIGDDPWT